MIPRWLPRPVDLAVAGALTVAAEVELWTVPLGTAAARPLLTVSYVVATASLAWHRLAPMVALAVAILGAFVVPSAVHVDPASGLVWLTCVLLVIASAGYHARRPLAALAEALLLIGAAVVLDKGFSPGDLIYSWLLCSAAWVAGRALGTRTLRAQLSEKRALLAEQEARATAAAAVAEERLRIARELHDVVSSGISGMTLQVSGVRRLLTPDQARERAVLQTVEQMGRDSLAEMQRMLGVLRTPEPADGSGAPGLGWVAALLEPVRAAGIETELLVTGTPRPLPPGVDLAAYRIVQEAVTNVLKHAAAATRLVCTVHHWPRTLELLIEDDGVGGGPGGSGGHGQIGMRERAALFGGRVETGPRPGGGYRVTAVLPMSEPAARTVGAP